MSEAEAKGARMKSRPFASFILRLSSFPTTCILPDRPMKFSISNEFDKLLGDIE